MPGPRVCSNPKYLNMFQAFGEFARPVGCSLFPVPRKAGALRTSCLVRRPESSLSLSVLASLF